MSWGAGVPTGVARRLLRSGVSLVGRIVSTAAEAATAATEGASMVMWQVRVWGTYTLCHVYRNPGEPLGVHVTRGVRPLQQQHVCAGAGYLCQRPHMIL